MLSLAREIPGATFNGVFRAPFVPGPTLPTYLDFLAFCRPSPPDYMRVILGTSRGALALFSASHESSFKVPSDCYTTATHRVLGLTAERASHVRKCPRCNEVPSKSRGSGSSSTVYRVPLCRVSAPRYCYAYGPHPLMPVLLVRHLTSRSGCPCA
jgi:hypothetical protein